MYLTSLSLPVHGKKIILFQALCVDNGPQDIKHFPKEENSENHYKFFSGGRNAQMMPGQLPCSFVPSHSHITCIHACRYVEGDDACG